MIKPSRSHNHDCRGVFQQKKKKFFSIFFLCAYYRGSHRTCSAKKAVLNNFTLLTGKRVCCPVNIAKFLRAPILKNICERLLYCVKIVRIRSYSGPYFPAFELNTGRYSVSLRIHSESRKMRTRITLNTDTFYAVLLTLINIFQKLGIQERLQQLGIMQRARRKI